MSATPEAAHLRGILTDLIERLENLVTWARLALALSERPREGQGPGPQ